LGRIIFLWINKNRFLMGKIIIQKAKQEDWDYIEEKLKKYALDDTDAEWGQFFVAKIAKETVGFGRIIERNGVSEIASLGVDYYYRKKGIGKALLEFLINEAKSAYPGMPIYGVTHRPGFLAPFGFKEVEKAPAALEHKKYHECMLDSSKIKIMRLAD
jgi:N-acetylglutamate synthase-like GNAT family acetyltransferase